LHKLVAIASKRIILPFVLLAIVILAGAMGRAPENTQIQIAMEQEADGRLTVTYELARYRKSLEFREIEGLYRKEHWKFETPGFRLVKYRGRDRIERLNGAKFGRLVISATPNPHRFKKEYQPISRYGEGGVMIYSGHFWPVNARGNRVLVSFNFAPATGAQVVAFGEHSEALTDWRSPLTHPAFIYMGPLEPVETPEVMAVVDPDAPQWIIDEFYDLTPRVFAHLADAFGFSQTTKPNLFLAAPLGEDEGRLSYAGDALPGQFQITLVGAAWKNQTQQALDIFRSSTVHEAVHLWQAAARPKGKGEVAWIHEGAADAIAAESLLAINYWDETDRAEYFVGARDECAQGLELGSLTSARERRSFRAMYACGHVIAAAVSAAEQRSVTEFWRAFISLSEDQNGYTEKMYFALVLERTGNAQFVDQLRYFVRTPLANPDREIGRLLAAALSQGDAPDDEVPLAPTGRR